MPKSTTIQLKLIAKSGPLAGSRAFLKYFYKGSNPIIKKFPETTTV